jgi:hypothetical protein
MSGSASTGGRRTAACSRPGTTSPTTFPDEVAWITQLDSDDALVPEAIETMLGRLADVPHARSLRFASRWADGPPACASVSAGHRVEYRDRLTGTAPWGEWAVLNHRGFFDQGMRYDESLRRMQSVALSLRIYRIAPSYHFPDVVRVMDRSGVSITRPAHEDARYHREFVRVYEVFFESFGDDLLAFSPAAYAKKMTRFVEACEGAELPREAWPEVVRQWRPPLSVRWRRSSLRARLRGRRRSAR